MKQWRPFIERFNPTPRSTTRGVNVSDDFSGVHVSFDTDGRRILTILEDTENSATMFEIRTRAGMTPNRFEHAINMLKQKNFVSLKKVGRSGYVVVTGTSKAKRAQLARPIGNVGQNAQSRFGY